MRDDEWISLLTEVSLFCTIHDIPILNMDKIFVVSERPRRNTQQNTNLHHYRVELFYTIIDLQLQELNNRFSEVNTNLLLCMDCLNPSNSFVAFALHLMKNIIGITNELSIALQKKKKKSRYSKCYMDLVKVSKQ